MSATNAPLSFEPTKEEMVLMAQGYAMRQVYWPDYTWDIQTKYLKVIDARKEELIAKGLDLEALRKQLSSLFNKINASFYHLEKLRENEKKIVEFGEKMAQLARRLTPQGSIGLLATPYEPIDYEYEALLVTLKSGLDITAIILAPLCELGSDNIISLINDAKQKRRPNELLGNMLSFFDEGERMQVIDEFRNKDDGTASKRNYAVHRGSLPTGTINIHFAPTTTEINVVKTRTMEVDGDITTLTKQENLDDYCAKLFYASCDLMMDALEVLLGEKLPRGQKMSVYEKRDRQIKEQKKAK